MYWIFIAFTLFSSLYGKRIDKALTGLPQDDPELIKTIHEQFLISPKMGMSYNLSKHQSKGGVMLVEWVNRGWFIS